MKVAAALDQVAGHGNGVIAEVPPEVAAQLAESLNARVVGLLRYGPKLRVEEGAELAKSLGWRLLGVIVNRVTQYRHSTVRSSLVPALEAQGLSVLGVVPEERRMLGVRVGELAEHLRGEFLLWEEKRDQLVDHLLIGGMVLESAADYFGRSERKAVIVRGNRPDIQMAALGTPTRCLILTGGHHPIQYVKYEAQEEEVPLILVQSDTLTAARNLEELFQSTTVHHLDKADCFAQLLAESVDVDALKSMLASS
jgi:BioD-like phosphotransacetylase family protein